MWGRYILFLFMFICAVLTVHLISWAGSMLHSVPNGSDWSYAVFTFREERNRSMSVNILMNILIPNVCMVLLYMTVHMLKMNCQYDDFVMYVIFCYVYRAVLICIILKRWELYSVGYEIFNSVIGILIAYLLIKYFLIKPQEVFIEVQELVNEFWLLVVLIIYKFVVLILDKIFSQKDVVKTSMLDRYIRNKFDYFYNKYKDVVYITKEDKIVWILIFAIMIFENYNRGGIKRKIERIKIFTGRTATVGIMQVTSNINISDTESITVAYEKLKNEIMLDDLEIDDEMQIEYYAFQYNPNEDYAKSVAYIYQHLRSYLDERPEYRKEFYLADLSEEYTDIHGKVQISQSEQEYNSSECDYWTLGDIMQMSGLTKKQIMKKIKKKKMVIYLNGSEVTKFFKKYLPKE